MDKNEQSLTIKEFKNAMSERRYDEAANLADLIDVKKIDDNNLLSLIADAYELSHDYELAKEVLLLAYENTRAGRHLAYRLCLISIKTKEYDDAEAFYEDFIIMAPKDTSRYVLQYKMAIARNESKDNLIKILEEYVNIDMEEKWAYELATLYKEVGENNKCVEVCDEIGLWFPGGKYLSRAMELKKSIAPLNITQQQMLDEQKDKEDKEAEAKESQEEAEVTEEKVSDATPHTSESVVQNIMDRQPAREEYKESVEDILKEVGAENKVELSFEKPRKFDITEIKLAEPEKPKKNILSARVTADDGNKFDVFDSSSFKKEEDGEVSIKERDQIFVKAEEIPEKEPDFIPNVKDVEDILQKLKERGILGEDTVDQAVQIIDNDPGYVNSIIEPDEEPETVEEPPKQEEELYVEGHGVEHETSPEEELYTQEIEDGALKKALEENIIANNFEEALTEEEVELEERVEEDIEKLVDEDIKIVEKPVDGNTKDIEVPADEVDEDMGATRIMDDLGGTRIMEDLSKAATGVIPTKDSIKIIGDKEQNAQVLDEAVTPIAEQDVEVPVFDLDVDIEQETNVVPMPVLKEGSAVIEMINMGDDQPEPTEEVVIPEQAEEPANDVSEEKEEEELKRKDKKIEKIENTEEIKLQLDREDMEVFGNYLNVEGLEDNIKNVVIDLIENFESTGDSSKGNVIIVGEHQTGKTTMAIEIIKLVNKKRGRTNRRIAKIDSITFNGKDFSQVVKKLRRCDLIIEDAHLLEEDVVSKMIEGMKDYTDDMLVILEGDTGAMEQLTNEVPGMKDVFDHSINIKQYDIKEWVAFGKEYVKEKGYTFDEMAELAFYKAIDDTFGKNKGISQEDVEGILDKAISKCEKFKISGIFSSHKDDEGLKILEESNFN